VGRAERRTSLVHKNKSTSALKTKRQDGRGRTLKQVGKTIQTKRRNETNKIGRKWHENKGSGKGGRCKYKGGGTEDGNGVAYSGIEAYRGKIVQARGGRAQKESRGSLCPLPKKKITLEYLVYLTFRKPG